MTDVCVGGQADTNAPLPIGPRLWDCLNINQGGSTLQDRRVTCKSPSFQVNRCKSSFP
jgi:hypothetical protein